MLEMLSESSLNYLNLSCLKKQAETLLRKVLKTRLAKMGEDTSTYETMRFSDLWFLGGSLQVVVFDSKVYSVSMITVHTLPIQAQFKSV